MTGAHPIRILRLCISTDGDVQHLVWHHKGNYCAAVSPKAGRGHQSIHGFTVSLHSHYVWIPVFWDGWPYPSMFKYVLTIGQTYIHIIYIIQYVYSMYYSMYTLIEYTDWIHPKQATLGPWMKGSRKMDIDWKGAWNHITLVSHLRKETKSGILKAA